MRVKSIITFSIISSFFLFSLISIWKILSTLQGIELKTLNFNFYFLSGIIVSFVSILLSEKLNKLSIVILLSSVFVLIDYFINSSLPIWHYIGTFLILLFFVNKLLVIFSVFVSAINYNLYYLSVSKSCPSLKELITSSSVYSISAVNCT